MFISQENSPQDERGEFKVDYKNFGAHFCSTDHARMKFRLESLAAIPETPLLETHIDPLLEALQKGDLLLRNEDLDILRRHNGVPTPLLDGNGEIISIDRNIAHLYFSDDGSFSFAYDGLNPGSQLLHGVSDVMVRTLDGKVLCIQWVDEDPAWRNLGIIGGHVPAGVSYEDAGLKEVPEELGWSGKVPPHYIPRGAFQLIGSPGQYEAPNPGDMEAKALGEYVLSDPTELAMVLDEQRELADLLQQLGEEGFFQNRLDIQKKAPGQGEIWAIHFLAPEELDDPTRMKELNIGVDLAAYLKEPLVRQALQLR